MSGKKKYSDEFKVKVVMDYLDGHSGGCRMLSDKYGIKLEAIDATPKNLKTLDNIVAMVERKLQET